ncbi:FAD-dependent oxidoreductase [Leucobacter allii]|uniref:FAD-dependent oxidoreductase n=1 Tax=Leucobacter allii TaxID=2932247 RepID=A0ABY4FRK9_9MICO|nr:FAD-dependent oxidoreductase [Leucobacter allii]
MAPVSGSGAALGSDGAARAEPTTPDGRAAAEQAAEEAGGAGGLGTEDHGTEDHGTEEHGVERHRAEEGGADDLGADDLGACDLGAEAFATRGGGVRELLEELGLAEEILRPAPLGSWVVSASPEGGDRAVPLPAAGVLGIPSRPFSRGALRVLGFAGAARAWSDRVLPRRIGRDADTLAALVRARLGARVLDRIVRPVALGVYSRDPGALAVAAVPGLAAAFSRRGSLLSAAGELRASSRAAGGAVAGLRGGMTVLVDCLRAELAELGVEVVTGVRATSLAPARTGGWVVTGSRRAARRVEASPPGDADPRVRRLALDAVLPADAVILAVPEPAARALLGEAPAASPADRVEIVALSIDDPRLDRAPRGTGALVAPAAAPGSAARSAGSVIAARGAVVPGAVAAERTAIRAKALTHVTAKWPGRTASGSTASAGTVPGRHILRLSYGRAGRDPETAGLSDPEACALALADASRILGVALDPRSVRGMARRGWHAGGPPAGASIAERAPGGVVCAGDWVSGTGLASVVPGARSAAERACAEGRTALGAAIRTARREGGGTRPGRAPLRASAAIRNAPHDLPAPTPENPA